MTGALVPVGARHVDQTVLNVAANVDHPHPQPPPLPMEILSARIASFKKTKRVKNPDKPSSSVTLKWPHPKDFRANPTTLADAGFFYDPSYDDDDNATCYMCGKELGGWEEDDDPFTIHWTKCGQTCSWASVRCGLIADVDHAGR